MKGVCALAVLISVLLVMIYSGLTKAIAGFPFDGLTCHVLAITIVDNNTQLAQGRPKLLARCCPQRAQGPNAIPSQCPSGEKYVYYRKTYVKQQSGNANVNSIILKSF